MGKVLLMVASVVGALAISGSIFVGLNYMVTLAQRKWKPYGSLLGLGSGLTIGFVLGLLTAFWEVEAVWTVVAVCAAVGGLLGAIAVPALGTTEAKRNRITGRMRTAVFFGPAVLFLSFALIVPGLRTAWISLQSIGDDGESALGFGQYSEILSDDKFFSLNGFGDIFTSRLFIFFLWTVVLGLLGALATTQVINGGKYGQLARTALRAISAIIAAIAIAMVLGFIEAVIRDPNQSAIYDVLTVLVSHPVSLALGAILGAGLLAVTIATRVGDGTDTPDFGAPQSAGLIIIGGISLLLAIFSTLTGVIWNNLWWVVAVAGLSTMLGLLLAILADRSNRESIAKALIFMPMAISMVGAAVIWDFMYTRQLAGNQIGLFNSVLDLLGYEPRGFFINASLIPWNNFFIMVIMIWIQTGFAMVILSAAIKGVPSEFVEAARVDGATEVQIFWRIILPTITSTIFVVLTTLIITVMKVFDLVKATTNGANGTDVLANAMFNDLRIGNFERSAAFAMIIFVLVMPVMIYNIRRTSEEIR